MSRMLNSINILIHHSSVHLHGHGLGESRTTSTHCLVRSFPTWIRWNQTDPLVLHRSILVRFVQQPHFLVSLTTIQGRSNNHGRWQSIFNNRVNQLIRVLAGHHSVHCTKVITLIDNCRASDDTLTASLRYVFGDVRSLSSHDLNCCSCSGSKRPEYTHIGHFRKYYSH